jgi:hypothetical protein
MSWGLKAGRGGERMRSVVWVASSSIVTALGSKKELKFKKAKLLVRGLPRSVPQAIQVHHLPLNIHSNSSERLNKVMAQRDGISRNI